MNHPLVVGKSELLSEAQEPTEAAAVLHLINGEHYSGAERVQDLLGLSLPDLGFDVAFACLKPGMFPAERQSNNELFEMTMRSKVDFKTIRKLRQLVVERQFRILHAHTPRTLMAGSLIKRSTGCPLVYHVHSPVGHDSTRSWANRINSVVENWSARQVDHFICVSDSIRDYMLSVGHPPEKLTTVANGVPVVKEVSPRSTPSGSWVIGTTALFRPRKGTEVLLESLAILKSKNYDVRMLAVGPFESTEYQQKIKKLSQEFGVDDLIEWTGFVNDVGPLFQKMDAFVLPSLFGEGLPMVILESMAIGTPVISSEVEGVNQAIRRGIDGLIFEPGNAEALADQVADFISGKHDWQKIRMAAVDRQRRLFSDLSMARGVAGVYEAILH